MHHVRAVAVVLVAITLSLVGVSGQQTEPAPQIDRVGFPEGYQTFYKQFFVFDRPDNRQIRVVYGNKAVSLAKPGQPFPYGSILVMETYRARLDSLGNPLRDEQGRFIRDQLAGIFVMRKEKGYGVEYRHNRNGEWEYVAYRPDRTYQTTPQNSFSCAICHLQATEDKDWVFRSSLFFQNASGSVPDALMQHYVFLPATVRVKAGSRVTWYNDDEVDHHIAVVGGFESTDMHQGGSYSLIFNRPGEYDYACRIHPAMRGKVIVE